MICMKTQKTPNGQNNVDKVEWSWTNHAPWLRNTLESYSYQNNMVLAQKQSYRLMEQDRRFRNKPLHLWSINLWHTDSMEVSLSELRELVMDRKAWHAAIHGVAKSWKRLNDWSDLIWIYDKMKVKTEVAQSCLTLCDPMNCSLPGFSVHGIFLATVLEWVAIAFSRGSSRPRDWTWVSRIVGRRFTL